MLITELQNRSDAIAFLEVLKDVRGAGVTERPYAAHILFLVTGLELEQAQLLLSCLPALNSVTGPYIAGHVFVDKLRVRTAERLRGIDGTRSRERQVGLRQLEGLSSGPLNHIEMEDLEAGDLTAATEHIARLLGVVKQLPCLVVVDAVEVASAGQMTVLQFPKVQDKLSDLVRSLTGTIAANQGQFSLVANTLLDIHELFDRRDRLNRERAAPFPQKERTLDLIFGSLARNPKDGKRAAQRARKVLGDSAVSRAIEAAAADQLVVRRVQLAALLDQLRTEDAKLAADVESCEEEIRTKRTLLMEGPSLSTILADSARAEEVGVVRQRLTAGAAGVLRTGLSDLAKPSFWLKLFGL